MLSIPIRCRDFFGRAVELEHLALRRKDAGERRGGAVLVAGEPGIGKSRLLAEFVAGAAGSRAKIVRAECREFAQSTNAPLVDLLTQLGEPAAVLRGAETAESQLELLLEAFDRFANRRGIIATVEDVHWANRDLIETLRLLVARAEHQRILFAISYRDNEITSTHPNFIALGRLARERSVSSISLERFTPSGTVAFLEQTLGTEMRLSHATLGDVARRSDGNPLYGEELLRHAVDARRDGHVSPETNLPITLASIVRERIARCSPAQRAALEMAALFGKTFAFDDLTAIGGSAAAIDESDFSQLLDLQLLVRDRTAGRFAFRHALTRDVMYADVPEWIARPVHRRIADMLDAHGSAVSPIVEIAYHRWKSGERASAAPACEAAGAEARAEFAYGESIEWYERAIAAYGDDESSVARVRLELGRALVGIHEIDRGIETYEAVVAWAQTHDVRLFVRARKLIAGTIANNGRRHDAIALLEATLGVLDVSQHARIASEIGLRLASYQSMGAGDEGTTAARASLQAIDEHSLDPAARAEYLLLRAEIEARTEDGDATWRRASEEAIALYTELEKPSFILYARVEFAMQAFSRGDLRLACATLEAVGGDSIESASSFNHLPLSYALVEVASGRFDSAFTWLARAQPSPQLFSVAVETTVRLQLALALDDLSAIGLYADASLIDRLERLDDGRNMVVLGTAIGLGLLRLGRDAAARRLFERIASHAKLTYEIVPAVLALATARPDLTTPYRARLSSAADSPFLVAARTMLAAEERRAGHADVADLRSDLAAARATYEAGGWAILAARAAEIAGDLVDAARRYRRMGHVAGLRRLGVADFDASDAREGSTIRTLLTQRELEVARSVGDGKSNREIAILLSLSVKTVEKHLSSCYTKLYVQSRAHLAAYVARSDRS